MKSVYFSRLFVAIERLNGSLRTSRRRGTVGPVRPDEPTRCPGTRQPLACFSNEGYYPDESGSQARYSTYSLTAASDTVSLTARQLD